MDSDEAQEISGRDQLWASLRGLQPEIERLAAGLRDDSERQEQLIILLAKIVVAEMGFRKKEGEATSGSDEAP